MTRHLILSALILVLQSCAEMPKRYKTITTTTAYVCPKDYLYNMYDGLCHYFVLPRPEVQLRPTIGEPTKLVRPTNNKRPKRAKKPVDCNKIFELMNQCQKE